ncbi:MAG: branched-chain amino acid transport system substrate-binding protein, partial [Hyphomicrobiales bacterium]|nr:branched-chain amino acid transport system substrate-binding protein [Hyphomicrobiales bacterium]
MRLIQKTIAAVLLLTSTVAYADIKIGAVLSVTGPASFLGDPEKKTLEMYVAEINAKGGINGQQVKLFVYDDGGDPNQARTFGTR